MSNETRIATTYSVAKELARVIKIHGREARYYYEETQTPNSTGKTLVFSPVSATFALRYVREGAGDARITASGPCDGHPDYDKEWCVAHAASFDTLLATVREAADAYTYEVSSV